LTDVVKIKKLDSGAEGVANGTTDKRAFGSI
jgi:hypothetical protein